MPNKIVKLASGRTARALPPWRGRAPESVPPPSVQLRILERQRNLCAIMGIPLDKGKQLDHKVPLADGGENIEENLQWICRAAHLEKTVEEASRRAKAKRIAAKHHGIRKEPTLHSRNDLPKGEPKAKKLPLPSGLTEIQRRYGLSPKSKQQTRK